MRCIRGRSLLPLALLLLADRGSGSVEGLLLSRKGFRGRPGVLQFAFRHEAPSSLEEGSPLIRPRAVAQRRVLPQEEQVNGQLDDEFRFRNNEGVFRSAVGKDKSTLGIVVKVFMALSCLTVVTCAFWFISHRWTRDGSSNCMVVTNPRGNSTEEETVHEDSTVSFTTSHRPTHYAGPNSIETNPQRKNTEEETVCEDASSEILNPTS